jgi:HD-GYP domain-containing protein (c-di-GMP phosphodiesterase class II)
MDRPVRLAELLAAVSVAIDTAMRQPLESGLAVCVTGTRLARAAGLSEDDVARVYYLALLRHIGCTAGNADFAAYLGNEVAFRERVTTEDMSDPRVMTAVMARSVFADGLVTGVRRVAFLASHPSRVKDNLAGVCDVARRLTDRFQLGALLYEDLAALYERYDGKGFPAKLPADRIPVAARVVHAAERAILHQQAGGVDAAVLAIAQARGKAVFPELADAFCADPKSVLPDDSAESLLPTALDLEPGRAVVLDDDQLDEGLRACADFVDLKSPYTVGHSRSVAALAGDAARLRGLPDREARLLRRAGWIHDLGRVTVSAGVWGKPATLSRDEREAVRLHPYHTERVFDRLPPFRDMAALAALHHERCDGSGYHRAAAAGALSPAVRVLAAADVYAALVADRPHRPALDRAAAARTLQDEARAGRLDRDACECVLTAAGHRIARRRREIAGFTPREVEVLRLVARGCSNKQIAAHLVLSPKTVERHLESIYDKAGVRTRAAATVFAMQHEVVTPV